MKMNIVQKYTKIEETHVGLKPKMNEVIGTHKLYHKINVFAVKTLYIELFCQFYVEM